MKRKFASVLLIVVLFVFGSVALAQTDAYDQGESIEFFDSSNGLKIGAIGEVRSLFAKVGFDAPSSGTARIFVAGYNGDKEFVCAITGQTTMVAGEFATYTTETILTSGVEYFRVFVWDASSLKPILQNPGMLKKTGISENKFIAKETVLLLGETIALGELFEAGENLANDIDSASVSIEASQGVTYSIDKTDWTKGTVTVPLTEGAIEITIADNVLCTPTTASFEVKDAVEKFASKEYTFVTGETVALGTLFDSELTNANVTVNGEAIEVGADWKATEITASAVGTLSIVITDSTDKFCKETTASFEVKDAVEKFASKEYTFVTGETVALSTLFNGDATNANVTVNGEAIEVGEDWKAKEITASAAGTLSIVIKDSTDKFCKETTASFEVKDAVEKFTAKAYTFTIGTSATLGDLFEGDVANVAVTVNGEAFAVADDWKTTVIAPEAAGTLMITITEAGNKFCKVTSAGFEVKAREPVAKFASKFDKNATFIYRVGNINAVSAGSLFKAIDGAEISSANVVITAETLSGNAEYTYTANTSDWTKSMIQFTGTGIVNVTITDNDYCIAETITLEVITATNATGATSATTKDIVLLNNAGFSSLEISGGHTLYGNGFKLTCSSDSYALDMSYSFVTLNNGTIDNAQIICPNFSHAVLYKSNVDSDSTPPHTDANDKTRYYNIKSAIIATGNNTIANSYISGGRACVYATSGTTLIDNTTIKGGAVANIQIGSALSGLTLRDATLIQVPTQANVNDKSKTLLGFSVLAMTDDAGVGAPITIEGNLTQYAWIDKSDEQYVPSAGSALVNKLLSQTDYLHTIDGASSLNLGIVYMAATQNGGVDDQSAKLADNRTNKDNIPYGWVAVDSMSTVLARVYSVKNTNGTDSSLLTEPEFTPNNYGATPMDMTYTDTNENRVFSKEFDAISGWTNKLMVNLDAGAYSFSFANLKVMIGGVEASYIVRDANGNTVDKSQAVVPAVGNINYTLVVTDPATSQTREASFVLGATRSEIKSPELVAANYEEGLCVASKHGGTWHGAAPALEGIQIKYWSAAESQYKTITLSDYTPTTAGKQNGSEKTWTYSPANKDFTLTLTGGQVHSSNNVYAMPVVCNGKLYFTPAASNGLVNSGNSARTINVSYSFRDNATDTALTFSHTWSVAENKDAEYSYSDFCDGKLTKLEAGGGGSGNCVTPETLITLADGSKKEVQYLTGEEELLVWNLETGAYDKAPIVFVDSDEEAEFDVVTLSFADGSETELIYEHGYFDLDLEKYVYITKENAKDFIGHRFVAYDDINTNTWKVLVLTDATVEKRLTRAYSPVTFAHLCYYVDGVLSMPGGIEGIFNIFEVDTDKMCYDTEKMEADIEAYGLFSYEDYNGMIPEIAYEAFNGDYLKVAIAKGMLTWEDIERLAERYVPLV